MQLSVKCRLSIRLRSYGEAGLSWASCFESVEQTLPRLARVHRVGRWRWIGHPQQEECLCLTIHATLALVQMMTELLHLS